MICPKCNSQVIVGAEFCPNCGNKLNSQNNSQYQHYSFNNNYSNAKKNNEKKSSVLIIVIIAIIMIIAVYVAHDIVNKKTNFSDTPQQEGPIINNDNNNSSGATISPEISENEYDINETFLMTVDDVFSVIDKGTAVTGRITKGTVTVGDTIEIIGLNHEVITTTVIRIEMFREEVDNAVAGDNVSIFLKDVTREQVERGHVLATPNSIK